MRRSAAVLVLAGCVACGGERRESAPAVPDPDRPNLVLFTVDTLRADHLGVYGYDRPTSPALDAFAAEAAVFERAQSPRALTWPALTTLHTGLEVHTHGVRRNGEQPRRNLTTLATVLSGQGYRTAAFLANACETDIPGFDQRECFISDDLKQFRWDVQATSGALAFLQKASQPFFLWIHLMDPHAPYNCTSPTKPIFDADYSGSLEVTRESLLEVTDGTVSLSPEDRRHIVGLYDCQVRHADDRFGDVLLALDRLGLSRKTLVAFSADHGEELGDHHDYWYHAGSPYQGCLHVPLLLRHPQGLGAGRRVGDLVGLVDVAPTLLDLMGLDPALLGPEVHGRSVAVLLGGEGSLPQRPVRGEIEDDVVVLRDGDLKYVWNPGGAPVVLEPFRGETARTLSIVDEAIFDLGADPHELQNLLASRPDVRRRMREMATALVENPDWKHVDQEIEPRIRDRLKALGYLSN